MSEATFQRDIFIKEIFQAAKNDRNIFFISADFGAPALDDFRALLPEQFIHSGISEQHMIDMAAGLALSGKKVYVYAMAPFITLRCLEQTKTSLALMNLPVTILAVGVGLGYADAGPTHYNTEDIACMRAIVGLEVWTPCDEISTRMMAKKTVSDPALRVIRMERHGLPSVYRTEKDLGREGYTKVRDGSGICVLSSGQMLHRVLSAADRCTGVNPSVIDLFRIKPIDQELVNELSAYQRIVTVEEQCLSGGFGSAILEVMADQNLQRPVRRLGLPERYFFENGGQEYLLDSSGLAIADIAGVIADLATTTTE